MGAYRQGLKTACAVFALTAAMTLAGGAQAQESTDPIKLTLHDWTGQLITTELMGEVLKKAGYSVEYVQADYLAQFAGLESGDLHVAMEMWETTGRDAMDAALTAHLPPGCEWTTPQGGMIERDMHAGQQYVRLLDVELEA